MKSKAKPAKGSARVKKFDVGGTVGALAGLGTLAYLMSRKKKAAEGEYKPQGKFPMEQAHEIATESKAAREKTEGEKRAMSASMGRPEMGDVTPEMESDKASRATPAPKAKPTTGPKRPTPAAKTSAPKASDTAKFTSLHSKLTTRDKPSVADQQAAISTVRKLAEAAKEKKTEAERSKGQGLTPYAPYAGPGSSSHAQMLRESRDPEKVRQRREESERKEKEAAKKRKGAADVQYDVMGNVINKRGGVIKKYAAGGLAENVPAKGSSKPNAPMGEKIPGGAPKKSAPSIPEWLKNERENQERDRRVKREREAYDKYDKTRLKDQGSLKKGGSVSSVSKRADGIAMRGKTKGKIY